jgi:hypothetical protein
VAGLGGNAEAVEAAKAAGLEYVKGCMLWGRIALL